MTSYGGAGQVYLGVWGGVNIALKKSHRYECECESNNGEESLYVALFLCVDFSDVRCALFESETLIILIA